MSDSTHRSILQLTGIISNAHLRAEERAKATHERFNVFTTLLSAHDEVRLHTRFIYNLLNPAGTHDCGRLFLDLFFETLAETPPLDHAGNPVKWEPLPEATIWKAHKEKSVSDGQIDLLLEATCCGIAIENKIHAAEQTGQLARYDRYLTSRHKPDPRLLFLTLDGKQATSHGTATYFRISYESHILVWLEKCLRETYRFIPINQVLLQYRKVVRQLTGRTLNSAIMKTVTDFVVGNPDIIRYHQQIENGIAGARVVFMDRLAEGITKAMGSNYQVRPRPDLGQASFGSHPNGALIITPPPESPLHGKPFEIWVEHISKWRAVVVGIESKFGKPLKTPQSIEFFRRMNQLLTEDAASRPYHKADRQILWDGTEWPTGWHDLICPIDNAQLATLIETPIEQTAASVCDGIRIHIALLERIYIQTSSELDLSNSAAEVIQPITSP